MTRHWFLNKLFVVHQPVLQHSLQPNVPTTQQKSGGEPNYMECKCKSANAKTDSYMPYLGPDNEVESQTVSSSSFQRVSKFTIDVAHGNQLVYQSY